MTPLITPQDLIDYTSFNKVKSRDTGLLSNDIMQADFEIFALVGHQFDGVNADGSAEFLTIPEEVQLASKKLAEYYALISMDEGLTKGYQSEKIGDYSYTLANGNKLNKPYILPLVSKYIKSQKSGKTSLRLRSI